MYEINVLTKTIEAKIMYYIYVLYLILLGKILFEFRC